MSLPSVVIRQHINASPSRFWRGGCILFGFSSWNICRTRVWSWKYSLCPNPHGLISAINSWMYRNKISIRSKKAPFRTLVNFCLSIHWHQTYWVKKINGNNNNSRSAWCYVFAARRPCCKPNPIRFVAATCFVQTGDSHQLHWKLFLPRDVTYPRVNETNAGGKKIKGSDNTVTPEHRGAHRCGLRCQNHVKIIIHWFSHKKIIFLKKLRYQMLICQKLRVTYPGVNFRVDFHYFHDFVTVFYSFFLILDFFEPWWSFWSFTVPNNKKKWFPFPRISKNMILGSIYKDRVI